MSRAFASSLAVVLGIALLGGVRSGLAQAEWSADDVEFERLATTTGEVYMEVRVHSVHPDSLVIEHRGGMARVSLFDLPDEIRDGYGFDYEKAMSHYKHRDAEQRALRQTQFLERIRIDAEKEDEARRQAFDAKVRANWIPVRARIISFVNGGAVARVDRIILRPTRTVTALGGEGLPGPPKRVYAPISGGPVFLRGLATSPGGKKPGSTWTGYVWPDGSIALDPEDPDTTTPAFLAEKPAR